MKLFACKGFYATTMQEIAEQSGVSKGAIYLYFKSKDDLIVSIFHYYYDLIRTKVYAVNHKRLSPREKFMEQLRVQFKEVAEHKEFIMMQFREQALALNEEIDHLIYQIRIETMSWYKDSLLHIYGDKLRPYLTDLAILLDGAVKSYLHVLIVDNVHLDIERLPQYVCHRLDDLVAGLIDKKLPPLVTNQVIQSIFDQRSREDASLGIVKKELVNILHQLSLIDVTPAKKEELKADVKVLLNELTRQPPRTFIFEGMLSTLRGYQELASSCRKIMDVLERKEV